MKMISSKKAAMEMSIGTIVTIILSVTMLILGIVLIQNIFSGGEDILNMGTDLAKSRLQTVLGENKKVAIYPNTNFIEMKQEQLGAVIVGIKNLEDEQRFSYVVRVRDIGASCQSSMTPEKAMSLIESGRNVTGIMLPTGEVVAEKVIFKIPAGTPLCTISYTAEVRREDKTAYSSADFDIQIKPK